MIEDILRPLWLPKINDINGKQDKDFKSWIASGNYIISSIDSNTKFSLFIADEYDLTKVMSFDCARMATAAFESVQGISSNPRFPKSLGWAAIRSYYGAFFAAHSILRVFGVTCSKLEKGHVKILNQMAPIYGISTNLNMDGGLFSCTYERKNKILSCTKLGNSHSDTWCTLYKLLKRLSNDVLSVKGLTSNKQQVSTFLSELCDALDNNGRNSNGNSLSNFRNDINYKHDHGVWFPYSNSSATFSEVQELITRWRYDPMQLSLSSSGFLDIKSFFKLCSCIIGLCRILVYDIADKNIVNNSFHNYGPIAFLNHEKSKKIT